MDLNKYYDFAENDYNLFVEIYKTGLVANLLGATAQGICEKYLKHLINEYYIPTSVVERADKQDIMRTHSLNKLMRFTKQKLDLHLPDDVSSEMRGIDGFYFSTRYPGCDSVELDKSDIEHCYLAINGCRDEIIKFINMKELCNENLSVDDRIAAANNDNNRNNVEENNNGENEITHNDDGER